MDERADSASQPCEAAYRKRRRSYSAAISDENLLDDDDDDDDDDDEPEVEPYPHRDGATRELRCRQQRECNARKVFSVVSETWSTESLVSKPRELTGASSGDTVRSSSEIEIPELLLARPEEILSRITRCGCSAVQFSSACRCRCRCSQCGQYQQCRKISSTSSCYAKESNVPHGAKRKDSGHSVSTCQSFLPPSSCGSLYHCCVDIGDNSTSIQRRHSIAAAAAAAAGPIQHRRYSDQTHSLCGGKIERADNRRLSSVQPHGKDAIGNSEGDGAAGAAEPIIAGTCPRAFPWATTGRAEQSAASFHRESSAVVPANIKAPKGDGSHDARPANGGKNARARRRSSAIPITPKMMRRRFSEQVILEGGLGSVGESESLLDQPGDADEAEVSLTAINARKRITLNKHYYPEGGWGYVIVVITILAQLIAHGLQLGSGSLMNPTMLRFEQTVESSGTTR